MPHIKSQSKLKYFANRKVIDKHCTPFLINCCNKLQLSLLPFFLFFAGVQSCRRSNEWQKSAYVSQRLETGLSEAENAIRESRANRRIPLQNPCDSLWTPMWPQCPHFPLPLGQHCFHSVFPFTAGWITSAVRPFCPEWSAQCPPLAAIVASHSRMS